MSKSIPRKQEAMALLNVLEAWAYRRLGTHDLKVIWEFESENHRDC